MKQKYLISTIVVIALAGITYGAIALRESNEAALESQASGTEAYKLYSPEAVTAAQANGKRVVIFFYADWCPQCREADQKLRQEASSIPDSAVVLRINYNADPTLERKYGVLSRHTFVEIDEQGNLVTKWVSGDIDMLKKYVK